MIPGPFPGVTDVIRRAMENVYGRFGLGPASSYGTSSGNWSDVYTGAAAASGHAPPGNPPPPEPAPAGSAWMTPLSGCRPPTIEAQRWAKSDDYRIRARRPLAWGVLATAGARRAGA